MYFLNTIGNLAKERDKQEVKMYHHLLNGKSGLKGPIK